MVLLVVFLGFHFQVFKLFFELCMVYNSFLELPGVGKLVFFWIAWLCLRFFVGGAYSRAF